MKLRVISSVALAVVALTACNGFTSETTKKTTGIGFNYKVEYGSKIGLVQTFEMGGNTTLQFRDIENKNLEFIDAKSNVIPFKVIGQYAVLTGIHNDFIAISNSSAAKITRTEIASTSTSAPQQQQELFKPSPTPVTVPSDDYLKSEIARVQKELADIKKILAENSSSNGKAMDYAGGPKSNFVAPADVIHVTYRNNSTLFEIADRESYSLMSRAKSASKISIKGYTDGSIANATSERLAKQRAESAKSYLVKNGIDFSKIITSYEASGGFVASNNTQAGKDANRRVEISMM